MDLKFDCDRKLLTPELSDRFVALGEDEDTIRFIEWAHSRPASFFATSAFKRLRHFMSDYDAYGLLNMYKMHLMSTEQWKRLIGDRTPGRLLDVGAGSGLITEKAAPLFREITATETSSIMARKLRKRGYHVHRSDLAQMVLPDAHPFDVISCLNVIDRCSRPISLLSNIRAMLSDSGILVLAVPLPLDPFMYIGGKTAPPLEPLPDSGIGWEAGVVSLVEKVILPLGFCIESISRVPYLSQGDAEQALYILDDVVLVCRVDTRVAIIGEGS